MRNRNETLLNIRLAIPNADTESCSNDIERFQNNTLRPIIKFQHDLLINIVQFYCQKFKINLQDLDKQKQLESLQKLFQQNKFKVEIQGIIIGLFTADEYQFYSENSSEINKRINQIVLERVLSVV